METQNQRHDFFKEIHQDFDSTSVYIPDMAMRLDNNCKEGAWFLGDTSYGNVLHMLMIKFSKRMHKGNDYYDLGMPFGELWFVPINGGKGGNEKGKETQLPLNCVYYTVLKNSRSQRSGSLINFGQKAVMCMSQGFDYREVVWVPRFLKKSGLVTNSLGQQENASWYVLDWSFILPHNQTLSKTKPGS